MRAKASKPPSAERSRAVNPAGEASVNRLLGIMGVESTGVWDGRLAEMPDENREAVLQAMDRISECLDNIAQEPGSYPTYLGATALAEKRDAQYFRRRQLAMRRNYQEFLETRNLNDFMLDYQAPLFTENIKEFLEVSAKDSSIQAGLFECPPAFGKTLLGVWLAQAMGVGREPFPGDEPLRGLTLVDDLTGLRQTIGDDRRGYEGNAREIITSRYFGDEKDLHGSMIIMTYASFMRLSGEDLSNLKQNIDLFILDEAHAATSSRRAERVRDFMADRMTFAASGSAKYNPEKSVQKCLGIEYEIANITPRDAVDAGIANGSQIILFATGEVVEFNGKQYAFSEKEYYKLRHSEERNQQILDTIRYETENGATGIVKCIRGKDEEGVSCEHARNMAAAARQMKIIDPRTGERRFVRAKAVGSFQKDADNEAIMEEFDRGMLDVVTFTDYLNKAYDSERIEYVYMAEPSTSIVETIQVWGRGARPKLVITRYYQSLDKYVKHRRAIRTFRDVLDITDAGNNVIVGRPAKPKKELAEGFDRDNKRRPWHQKSIEIAHMSQRLQKAVALATGKVIHESTHVAKIRPEPYDGWLPVDSLAVRGEFSEGKSGLRSTLSLLERAEVPYMLTNKGYYTPPNADEKAKDVLPQRSLPSHIPIAGIRKGQYGGRKVDSSVLWRIFVDLDIHPAKHRDEKNRHVLTIDQSEYQRYLDHMNKEYPMVDSARDVVIESLCEELNRTYQELLLAHQGKGFSSYPRYDENRKHIPCIDNVLADWFRVNVGIKVPDEAVMLEEIAQEANVDIRHVPDLIRQAGFQDSICGGIIKGGHKAQWFKDKATAHAFKQWLKAYQLSA